MASYRAEEGADHIRFLVVKYRSHDVLVLSESLLKADVPRLCFLDNKCALRRNEPKKRLPSSTLSQIRLELSHPGACMVSQCLDTRQRHKDRLAQATRMQSAFPPDTGINPRPKLACATLRDLHGEVLTLRPHVFSPSFCVS